MTQHRAMTPEQLQGWLDSSPYIRLHGLECVQMDAAAGTLHLRMPMRDELRRMASAEQFHGGAIASLIDTAGAFAVIMGTQAPVPTINFRVDFLRPASGAHLLGKALVRRVGRSVGVVDVDVLNERERLVAVGRGCFGAASA